MNLIIDIGNTRTKVAVFNNNVINKLQIFDSNTFDINKLLDNNFSQPIILSSVKSEIKSINSTSTTIFFDNKTPLPIKNDYKSETIGGDRLASAVGASTLFPNKDCLIIDLGSAITIDLLTKDQTFVGGNISVGMSLRFKTLYNYTEKLPLIEKSELVNLTSDTTEMAIRSGVIKGIVYELEGYINEYKKRYPEIKIILTGGDANFFEKQLKKRIFADENIVLKGLNRILEYNVDTK